MVIAFHKPYGVLCQFTPDQPGQRTLSEFGLPPGVYPLGRLDMDSEGLLLMSDEPGMNHRLLDPERGHPRSYLVQVEGVPDGEALRRLGAGGIGIKGHRTRPATVTRLDGDPGLPPRDPPVRFRKSIPTSWLRIELTERKNRQVRRMTAAVGHPTLRLARVAVGTFSAAGLAPGAWLKLTPDDIAAVFGHRTEKNAGKSRDSARQY